MSASTQQSTLSGKDWLACSGSNGYACLAFFSYSVLSKGLNIFRRFAPSCTATNLSPDVFTSRGMVEGLKGYGLGSIPCYCSVIKIANLGLVSGLLGNTYLFLSSLGPLAGLKLLLFGPENCCTDCYILSLSVGGLEELFLC